MAVSSDVRMRKPCLQMLLFSRGFKHMAGIERYVALNLESYYSFTLPNRWLYTQITTKFIFVTILNDILLIF